MRWSFRRQPSGKHALGAAVTAIPAGPVVAVRQLPVDLPTVPVQSVAPAQEPAPLAPARDVLAAPPSVVPPQPVVTEHVVGAPVERFVEPPALFVPEQPVLSAPPVEADAPARPVRVDLPTVPVQPAAPVLPEPPAPVVQVLPAPAVPVVPVQVLTPAPPAQPLPVAPPASGLDALLAAASAVERLAVAPAVARPAAPAVRQGTRVELGFADGSIRMLDPESETARALSQLVGELTSSTPSQQESPAGEGSDTR